MATYKISSDPASGKEDAAKKVTATFEAAMAKALVSFRDVAKPGNFKVLASNDKPFFSAGTTDNTKEQKIADVKATGDQEAIKRLDDPNLADISNTGVPLADIASITKVSDNVLELKTRDGQDIVIIKQMTPYLFDGMAGKVDAVNALNQSKTDGYRIAQAGDTAPGMANYKAIGPADEVGPGFIRYETASGDKVVVSKEVNRDLYEKVKADGETLGLINDSQNAGYRLAGADETGGVQLVGTPQELGHGLIRYETAAGDKIIVSQEISPDLYASVTQESDGIFGVGGAVDSSWIDNSQYASGAKEWDKIVGNTASTPTQAERDLDRPRAAAKMLSDNWDTWGLHDRKIDFSNPPTDLPPEAQACLKYLAGSPSLMNALDSGGLGKSDGVITHSNVDSFINQSNKDLSAASKSYSKFLEKNPDASGLAKENAKSAAIVMANISLVSSAGPEMQGADQRTNNGSLTTNNLNAIKSDSGLSLELTGAAGYWSTPGMLRTMDMAGDLPATATADGITQQKNIGAWLENQAPKDDHGVLMMLSNASVRSSVADVDTSKLTKDVLEHPENYDGKTKAAAMLEISDARARMAVSDKVGDGDLYAGIEADSVYHLNPTKSKVTDQLDAAISQLASDPDVKTFLSQNQGNGMRDVVNSDPAIKRELQAYQDGQINSGNILNTALATKDADGNPLSLVDALGLAGTDATLTDLALGGDGNVDLAAIADKSGKSGDIEQYFKDHILNGKDLEDALAQPDTDPMTAIGQYAANASLLKEFLGDKVSLEDSSVVQQYVNQAISDTLVNGANDDVLKGAFGDADGNFDEAKTKAIIDKAMADDPQMFKDATGAQIDPADVVSLIRSVWDVNRQGQKISDVLPKAVDGIKLNASDAYKQGLLHIGSALLAGGVLAARSATGGNSAADNAGRVSAGMQFAGLLTEGGTKYAKEAGYGMAWKPTPIDPSKPQGIGEFPTGKMVQNTDGLNKLGNLGKLVGGSGSFIGGVFGLISGVNSAFAGDKLNAGFSLTGGALGTGAAVASIIEGAAGLFGIADAAAIAGTFAGVLGWAAAGIGIVTAFVFPIIEVVKRDKQQGQFFGALVPTLEKYGLTGGPVTAEDKNDEYPPYANTGFA
jgi:hypothetical protein